MEFLKKLNTVFLSLAVLLAVGCGKDSKKEDPEPEQVQNPVKKTCKLTGLKNVSSDYRYIYDSNGRVYRVSHTHISPTFSYWDELIYNSDGNIAEVKSYDFYNVQTGFKLYTYNAVKLPETIKNYEITSAGSTRYLGLTLFEYNASKQLIKKSILGPNQTASTSYSMYSYPAANQVKEERYSGDGSGNTRLVSTSIVDYDTKNSPLSLLNFYNEMVLVSKHNAIAVSHTNHSSGTKQISTSNYEYNDADFPVKQVTTWQGSNPPFTNNWTYTCE